MAHRARQRNLAVRVAAVKPDHAQVRQQIIVNDPVEAHEVKAHVLGEYNLIYGRHTRRGTSFCHFLEVMIL